MKKKIGRYYRLQSPEYDVGPESISWIRQCRTLEGAKKDDINIWEDDSEFYSTKIKELEQGKSVSEVWQGFIDEGYESECVQKGLNCFSDLALLLEYWEEISDIEELGVDGYYILIFKGEYVCEGTYGGDCVKYIKEIDRICLERVVILKDMFAEYNYEFDYRDIWDLEKFIKNASYDDIEDVLAELGLMDDVYDRFL